jgi:hypothetical protein
MRRRNGVTPKKKLEKKGRRRRVRDQPERKK